MHSLWKSNQKYCYSMTYLIAGKGEQSYRQFPESSWCFKQVYISLWCWITLYFLKNLNHPLRSACRLYRLRHCFSIFLKIQYRGYGEGDRLGSETAAGSGDPGSNLPRHPSSLIRWSVSLYFYSGGKICWGEKRDDFHGY